MKTVGEIFGLVAIIVNFLIYQQKERDSLLKVKLLSDLAWTLHYGLLTAFSGMAVCLVGALRETVFILTKDKQDNRKYFLLAFCLISIITSLLTMKDAYGLLPAVASLIAVFSYWQANTTVTKLLGLPISLTMLTYDFVRFSIMGIINEILTIISILIFFIFTYLKRNSKDKK